MTPAYRILFQPAGALQNIASVFQSGVTTFTATGDDASLPVSAVYSALQVGDVVVTSAAGGDQPGDMLWADDLDINGIGANRTLSLLGFNDVGGPYAITLEQLEISDSVPGGETLSLVLTANVPGAQLSIGNGATIGPGVTNVTLDAPAGGVFGEASVAGASLNITGTLDVTADAAQINSTVTAGSVVLFGDSPSLAGSINANTVSVTSFDGPSDVQAQITGDLVTGGAVNLTGSVTGSVTATAGTGRLVQLTDVSAGSIGITAKSATLLGLVTSPTINLSTVGGSTTVGATVTGNLQVVGGSVTIGGSVSGAVDLMDTTAVSLKDVTFGFGPITIEASGAVTTEGQVSSGGAMDVDSGSFRNTGTLSALEIHISTSASLISKNDAGEDLTQIHATNNLVLSAQGPLTVERLLNENFNISLAGTSVSVLGRIDADDYLIVGTFDTLSVDLEEPVEARTIQMNAGSNATLSLLGSVFCDTFSAASIGGGVHVSGPLTIGQQGSVAADLILEDTSSLSVGGTLAVTGDVQFLTGSTYIAVMGPPSQLLATGTTTIAAGAVLDLRGTFVPPTATLLTADSGLSGRFNTTNLPPGATAAYTSTALSIASLVPVVGNVFSGVDDDGTPFTVKLTGPGTLSAFDGLSAIGIVVTGSTAASKLSVMSKGNATAGLIEIESVAVNGAMNSVSLPKADVLGGLSVSGSLKSLIVRDLYGDLTVGGLSADKTTIRGRNVFGDLVLTGGLASLSVGDLTGDVTAAAGGTLTVSGMAGGDWQFDGVVKSLRAAAVDGLRFEADALGSLMVLGNTKLGINGDVLDSQFLLLGNPADPKKPALGTMKVAGAVMGSAIRVAGNVTSVSVGRFIDSKLWVGYSSGPATSFTDPGLFLGTFKLESFTTTAKPLGLPATWAFQRSEVVAAVLGTVKLSAVNAAAVGSFGIKFRDSFGKVSAGVAVGGTPANTPLQPGGSALAGEFWLIDA